MHQKGAPRWTVAFPRPRQERPEAEVTILEKCCEQGQLSGR